VPNIIGRISSPPQNKERSLKFLFSNAFGRAPPLHVSFPTRSYRQSQEKITLFPTSSPPPVRSEEDLPFPCWSESPFRSRKGPAVNDSLERQRPPSRCKPRGPEPTPSLFFPKFGCYYYPRSFSKEAPSLDLQIKDPYLPSLC